MKKLSRRAHRPEYKFKYKANPGANFTRDLCQSQLQTCPRGGKISMFTSRNMCGTWLARKLPTIHTRCYVTFVVGSWSIVTRRR